jgi:hypothetical protein
VALNAAPFVSGSANITDGSSANYVAVAQQAAGTCSCPSCIVPCVNRSLVSLRNEGTRLTATFASPHSYDVNDPVSITGGSAADDADLNATYLVKAVPSATTVELVSSNVSDGTFTSANLRLNALRHQNEVVWGDPRTMTINCTWQTGSSPSDETLTTAARPSNTMCTKFALSKFLETRYGTIEALNEAWSNGGKYTTFGSSETVHSNELAAVSDGSTVVYTFAIPGISDSNEITKFSMRFYVNGKIVAFDSCQQLSTTNICAPPAGHLYGAQLLSDPNSTANLSTVNYQTGAVTLRFRHPYPSGTEIRVDYTTGGFGTGEGTGILDEYNVTAPSGAGHTLTGMDPEMIADLDDFLYWHARNYFLSMRRVIWEMDSPGNPSACATPGTCMMYFGTTYLSGWGGTPTRDKILQAARGVVDVYPGNTIAMSSPPDTRDQSIVKHVYAHMGDAPIVTWESFRALEAPEGFMGTSCVGGIPGTAVSAAISSATVSNGVATIAMPSGTAAGAPGMWVRISGNAALNGDYQMITSQAITSFTIPVSAANGSYPGGTARIFRFMDTSTSGHSRPNLRTQAERGEAFKAWMKSALGMQYPNGSYPYVGYRWWEWRDNYRECSNWGLTTLNDDLYDGTPGRAVGKDELGYPTGGWPLGGYSNFISHFKEANAYWLNNIPGRSTRGAGGGTQLKGRIQ